MIISEKRSLARCQDITDQVAKSEDSSDKVNTTSVVNLSNYKKFDLSKNINFVVVFQAIEIQRLTKNIQQEKIKYERQFDRRSYQAQIEALSQLNMIYKEMYDKMQKIVETLSKQNEALKKQLEEKVFQAEQINESNGKYKEYLIDQIDKWKYRYQFVERRKAEELEELRNLMENQRKTMIARQIKQAHIKFDIERNSLNFKLKQRDIQVQNLFKQLTQLNEKIEEFKNIASQNSRFSVLQLNHQEQTAELNTYQTKEKDFQTGNNIQDLARLYEKDILKLKQQFNELEERLRQSESMLRIRCRTLEQICDNLSGINLFNVSTKLSKIFQDYTQYKLAHCNQENVQVQQCQASMFTNILQGLNISSIHERQE